MEEKKSIKVNLSTVILLFIIVILTLVIIGMWCYYNNVFTSKNKVEKVYDNENTIGNIKDNSEIVTFSIGYYKWIPSVEDALIGDDGIEFKENNTFVAILGEGDSIFGTYEVSNENKIICLADEFNQEFSEKPQKISAKMTFEILDNETIKLIEKLNSFKITRYYPNGNGMDISEVEANAGVFAKGERFKLTSKDW